MNVKEISKEIFEVNKANGFWDKPRNFGELLMLVTSELGEALEAHRKDNVKADPTYINKMLSEDCDWQNSAFSFKSAYEKCIKGSVDEEIADAVIRLLDMCEGLGIDLEWHIRQKLEYNKTRGFKHGKLY